MFSKLKWALTIILSCFVTNLCRGQDTVGTALAASFCAIGMTIGLNELKEENLLPLVHSGYVTSLSYEHRRTGENYQELRVALGFSRIVAAPEDLTKSFDALINASYSYDLNVIRQSQFAYFIGPQAKLFYSVMLYPNWDDSHLYWGNYFSIGVNNVLSYSFEDNTRLFSCMSLPILCLFSRSDLNPLYKMGDASFGGITSNLHSDIKAGFWNTLFAIHLSLEYQFPVFTSKTEAFSYSVDYLRMKKRGGNPFTQLVHEIGLKVLL
jgi:hypothetical protein